MSVPVQVPSLSESATEATLLEWKHRTGSWVKTDEVLVEIETDKIVMEIPAPADGWIDILAETGTTVVAGDMLARISETQPSTASAPLTDSTGPVRIFLSYRREDSIDISDRIFEYVVQAFGETTVFRDLDSIPLGFDFRKHLRQELDSCTLVLAVIGRNWVTIADEAGKLRLASESDFVRIELEIALSRSIPVVPVLVGGAVMPSISDLPPSLQELVYRHGTSIRSGPYFRADMELLIRGLRHHFPGSA